MIPALVCLAFVLLLAFAACFSALETALQVVREKGNGGGWHAELLRDPVALLSEVLLLGGVTNLLLATGGLWLILNPWSAAGQNPWAGALLLVAAGLILVELIPNACALRAPQQTLRATLPVFLVMRKLISPFAGILRRVSERLVGSFTPQRLQPRKAMLAEEVQTLIDMREEQGGISADEAALLHGIVSLHNLIAKDVLTPRVDLPLMPHDAQDREAADMLETARHRFVAVFDETADAIAWLVDVERWKLSGRPHWSTITQAPIFIPETLDLLDAWREHLHDDSCAVVAVDEYGGFEGLLTRGNVISLVLAKAAPAQNAVSSIQAIGRNRYLVAGGTRLDEIERDLEMSFDAEGVDTIGGLVMNHFGYPPKPGEKLTIGGLDIKVKRTTRARVQQLELHVIESDDEEKDEE
jgi:CBS domain containing-hemolysin-like protein